MANYCGFIGNVPDDFFIKTLVLKCIGLYICSQFNGKNILNIILNRFDLCNY